MNAGVLLFVRRFCRAGSRAHPHPSWPGFLRSQAQARAESSHLVLLQRLLPLQLQLLQLRHGLLQRLLLQDSLLLQLLLLRLRRLNGLLLR